jgi:DNA-binding transcriptional LysR family regulator
MGKSRDNKGETMELRQLKTFMVVADELSFTRASQRLHMAQSSVSAQVKALETDLGVKVFDRIGRRVLLTDAGRKLYRYARRMKEMTREIKSQFSADDYIRGSLTVRVPETVAGVYMPEIVQAFSKAHPRVALQMINCSDEQLREELNSGRIDLAFLLSDAIHLKEVNIRRLRSEKLLWVAGQDHPLVIAGPVGYQDLADRRFLRPLTD